MCNGVDISDLTKWLPKHLWDKLTPEVQQEAREAREAKKKKRANIAEVDVDQEHPAENAGDSFGHGSYQDKNKKQKTQQE